MEKLKNKNSFDHFTSNLNPLFKLSITLLKEPQENITDYHAFMCL